MVNPTGASHPRSQKKVKIQIEDDEQLGELSDDIPMSQQSTNSDHAGYV
jgi:hypothetical protein